MSEIDACPHCDSTNIYHRRTSKPGANSDDDHDYHCNTCQQSFDSPRRRERKHAGGPSADAILKRVAGGSNE